MKTHHRLLIVVAGPLALSACGASSGAITETDRSAINRTVQAFTADLLKGDYPAAASLWTEDGWILPPHAAAMHGRADIARFFAGFGKVNSVTENVVESDGRGDIAYARFDFVATFVPPGASAPITDKGKGLLAMSRQSDGTWLTTRAAWNSDLPLPK